MRRELRAGEAGFVHALDEKILVYPEYRGNGITASLGNITENPHAALLFVDFVRDKIGLHVNGAARILSNDELLASPDFSAALRPDITETSGRRPSGGCWSRSKRRTSIAPSHIPRMEKVAEEARQWAPMTCAPKAVITFSQICAPKMMTIPLEHSRDEEGRGDLPLLRGGCRLLMESADGELIRVKGVADASGQPGRICRQRGRPCPRVIRHARPPDAHPRAPGRAARNPGR